MSVYIYAPSHRKSYPWLNTLSQWRHFCTSVILGSMLLRAIYPFFQGNFVLGEGPDYVRQWLYILDSHMMRRAELQTNHHLEVSWIRWWAESAGQAWHTQTYSVCSIASTAFHKKELWPIFVNYLIHVQILPELGLQCSKSDLFLVGVGLCQDCLSWSRAGGSVWGSAGLGVFT